jgi:triphosphatase
MTQRRNDPLIETELKIALDPGQEARLRRLPALAGLRIGSRRTQSLVSVYFDTPDHALSARGIALRLRKEGRRWIQTVKFGKRTDNVLFSRSEIDMPAPGGRLALDGADPHGVLAEIGKIAGGGTLSPVFETRIRRVIDHLRLETGDEVELALDQGEVVAGDRTEPIHEAEIELKAGEIRAVYDVAQMLFAEGPVRFAQDSKAARGYRLLRGETLPRVRPRKAGELAFEPDATVESVARDVFHDCFAQIAANMEVIADSDDIEGPHQLRVGLRRLRTAFSVFGSSLGKQAFASLSATARDLGKRVGALRDVDVLIDEVVGSTVAGLDDEARTSLVSALENRRAAVRDEVRQTLVEPASVAFLFDLGRMIEGRGWLVPSDYSQTERLAVPLSKVAPKLLEKRYKKVVKAGRKIRELDPEELHSLRKQLKKLRYTADVLDSIFPARKVKPYIRSLKALQDEFGSLNDAKMAGEDLSGSDSPGRPSPSAQRAVGWILGTLAIKAREDRPKLFDRWDAFAKAEPFWR